MTRKQKLLGASALVLALSGTYAIAQQPASMVPPPTQPEAAAGGTSTTSNQPAEPAGSVNVVTPGAPGAAATPTAGERLTTRVSLDQAVPVQQPGAWSRVTGRLMDVPDARVREKVVVTGIVTYEAAEGGTNEVRARTQWTSVERTDTGAKKILDAPLESAVRVPNTVQQMPPGQALTAAGNVAAVEAAALSLFEEEAQSSEAGGSGAPAAVQQSSASGPEPQSARGAGQQNAFPDKLEADPFRASADAQQGLTEVVSTTTEGCEPIVDMVNGVVKQTSQLVTNGQPSGNCSDNGQSFQIKYDNTACTDEVDLAGLTAYGRARAFYVNSQAEVVFLQPSCERQEGEEFDIAEDETACTVQTDLSAMVATPRAELAYVNGRGQRTVVRGCQPVTGGVTIPITLSSDGCSLNHDFTAGVSTQFQMARYTYNTQIVQASGCQAFDASPEFVHIRTATGCTPITDRAAGFAYPSFQTQINRGQGPEQILACQPDLTAGSALIETVDGCTDRFSHSVAAGQSFGMSRLYHTLNGGQRSYVSDCEVDPEQVYIHQISEPMAWQNNDQNRTGRALRRITISAHGQTVEVQGAQILTGEPEIPYSFVRQDTVPDLPNVVYNGCDKTTPTILADIYTRPDGTQYNHQIGAGATIGPVNACTSIIQTPVWTFTGSTSLTCGETRGGDVCNDNGGCNPVYYPYGITYCAYQGARRLQREDGQIIDQISSRTNTTGSQTGACVHTGCSTTFTGAAQIQWNQTEGW